MTKATTRRDPEAPTEDDPAAERDLLADEPAEARPYDDDTVQEDGL